MAADDITERFSDIQDELIADATKAESERDAALARVAELETLVEKMQPVYENVMNTITKIKKKWIEGASRSWGNLEEEERLEFTRFFDGDTYNFIASNVVGVLPYEWFSAEDGREWCVSFEQGGDIGLSAYERAFVLNNFELLASHFARLPVREGGPLPNSTYYADDDDDV